MAQSNHPKKSIARLFSATQQAVSSVVIDGGSERQERNGVTYLPWQAVQEYPWLE